MTVVFRKEMKRVDHEGVFAVDYESLQKVMISTAQAVRKCLSRHGSLEPTACMHGALLGAADDLLNNRAVPVAKAWENTRDLKTLYEELTRVDESYRDLTCEQWLFALDWLLRVVVVRRNLIVGLAKLT